MIQIMILKKKVNEETLIWQTPETDYWINFLKKLIEEHFLETNSELIKKNNRKF